MATDYTIPTYSRPDLGWDVPKYVKKYYDDLAAKKAEEESATVSEGAGVRSDQLYDSADPKTRNAVGWGGGKFSDQEVSSGQGDPNVTRYDQWGNEVDMGNRTAGLAVMKMMEKLPQAVIPGYGLAKFIESKISKPGQTTASTDSTPLNILDHPLYVADDTEDAVTTVSSPITNYSWPTDEQQTTQQSWGTGTSTVNPLNVSEMGLLDMLRQAAEQNADQANVAIDASMDLESGPF